MCHATFSDKIAFVARCVMQHFQSRQDKICHDDTTTTTRFLFIIVIQRFRFVFNCFYQLLEDMRTHWLAHLPHARTHADAMLSVVVGV